MRIFTVGHGNHSFKKLIELLQSNGVNVVVDIRSRSSVFSQHYFQKAALKNMLKAHSIKYLYLGDHFDVFSRFDSVGEMFKSGDVSQNIDFQMGISRLEAGVSKGYQLCLMTIEEDPNLSLQLQYILPELQIKNISVYHIRGNCTLDAAFDVCASALPDEPALLKKRNLKNVVLDAIVSWKRRKTEYGLQLVD